MNKKLILFFVLAGLLFTGCPPHSDPCFYPSVYPTEISFSQEGDSKEIYIIDCGWAWKLYSCPDWITIIPEEGVGSTSVTATARIIPDGEWCEKVVFIFSNGDRAEVSVLPFAPLID